MQFSLTCEEISHFLTLLISYAVIVTLFIKNQCEVKRLRTQTQETVHTAESAELKLLRELQRMQKYPLSVALGQGIDRTARAQVLRTKRRA